MKAAVYNFEPKFCPQCGGPAAQLQDEKYGHARYNLRNSFTCECGLVFERVSTAALIAASIASEGDLHEKMNQEEKTSENSKPLPDQKRVA